MLKAPTVVSGIHRLQAINEIEKLSPTANLSLRPSIPQLALPAQYQFGDNFHSLDVRLSRSLALGERWSLSLIGEVFNLYNKANLSGYSGDLTSAAFGQPTGRLTQIFGSGGPRAFQVGTRVRF